MATKMVGPLGRDTRANRIILTLLGTGFIALLAAAAAVFWVQRDNEASSALVSHTLAVEARLGAFASANERLETALRAFRNRRACQQQSRPTTFPCAAHSAQ